MDLKQPKCENCGAPLPLHGGERVICTYCGSAFVNKKAAETAAAAAPPRPVYTPPPVQQPAPRPAPRAPAPPRPKISFVLAAILLCFYAVPGVLYIVYKLYKQHEWDQKYRNH